MKMFQKIQELIDDPDALVCVLIDEVHQRTRLESSIYNKNFSSSRACNRTADRACLLVSFVMSTVGLQVESLTAARKSAVSGNEPSDAIRVVNALLTQLDAIKK